MSSSSEEVPLEEEASHPGLPTIEITAPTSGTLQQQRSLYADAFLSRCTKVDPEDFDLPYGVYICPWMPKDPQDEEYYEAGNCGFGSVQKTLVECVKCGKRFFKHSYDIRGHEDVHRHEMDVVIDQLKQEEAASKGTLSYTAELIKLYRDYSSYCKNAWKKVPKDDKDETGAIKDMSYWASRCLMKPLPLFSAEAMCRPDINCSLAIKERHDNKKVDLGSQCFKVSLLPSDLSAFGETYAPCAIQTTWQPLDDTLNPGYSSYNERYRLGVCYTKDNVWAYNQRQTWRSETEVWRPFTPKFSVPADGLNHNIVGRTQASLYKQYGGPGSDVWTTENTEIGPIIKPILEDLASSTNDCPLPRYQMIIDPNQFVRSRRVDGKKVWVPCEFDIDVDGSRASLVGGDRAHWLDSNTIDSVATPVLNAALPMLAKLRKPCLLLEGQRLQVVVKAQSITVPKKRPDDDPPEYIGLWHVDGEHEQVAAVVLYYYDVSDDLIGGNMELMDRRPLAVFGEGDTGMPNDFPPGGLREALRPNDNSEPPLIANCSVPIKTGTLLVFSNYQMAHRVLRMVNTSQSHNASRKFVALFVMDPAAERLVPARSHLAKSYLYQRALCGKSGVFPEDAPVDSLPAAPAYAILEFMGVVPSIKERRRTRNEMLRSQLLPMKTLGGSKQLVCSTGNGCLTMIGWIDSLLADHAHDIKINGPSWERRRDTDFQKPRKRVNALNFPSKEVGRGLSETLSIPSDDLDLPSFYDTLEERKEHLNADFDKMH